MTCEMASFRIDQSATEHVDARVLRVAGVVFLGPLMRQIDWTDVNASLSTISRDLHAPLDWVQWIMSGYLLDLALTMPLNACLVHRLGAKRLYPWCFSAFTLASVLSRMETTIHRLIWANVRRDLFSGIHDPYGASKCA
jgi:MFS family permease